MGLKRIALLCFLALAFASTASAAPPLFANYKSQFRGPGLGAATHLYQPSETVDPTIPGAPGYLPYAQTLGQTAAAPNAFPLYRLYTHGPDFINQYTYTGSATDKATLLASGWIDDGVAGYLLDPSDPNGRPLYRIRSSGTGDIALVANSYDKLDATNHGYTLCKNNAAVGCPGTTEVVGNITKAAQWWYDYPFRAKRGPCPDACNNPPDPVNGADTTGTGRFPWSIQVQPDKSVIYEVAEHEGAIGDGEQKARAGTDVNDRIVLGTQLDAQELRFYRFDLKFPRDQRGETGPAVFQTISEFHGNYNGPGTLKVDLRCCAPNDAPNGMVGIQSAVVFDGHAYPEKKYDSHVADFGGEYHSYILEVMPGPCPTPVDTYGPTCVGPQGWFRVWRGTVGNGNCATCVYFGNPAYPEVDSVGRVWRATQHTDAAFCNLAGVCGLSDPDTMSWAKGYYTANLPDPTPERDTILQSQWRTVKIGKICAEVSDALVSC